MPELPEVEHVCVFLQKILSGQTIRKAVIGQSKLRYALSADCVAALQNLKIVHIWRRGKYILCQGIKTTPDHQHYVLIVHLGMTGKFKHRTPPAASDPIVYGRHDHVCFSLSNDSLLLYEDMRKFGFIQVVALPDSRNNFMAIHQNLSARVGFTNAKFTCAQQRQKQQNTPWIDLSFLGMEPFNIKSAAEIFSGAGLSNIKNFLMKQKPVAGIGNIYASEILHAAGIHPERSSGNLTAQEQQRCVHSIKEILRAAITAGGTTVKDYLNPGQQQAVFQSKLKVYGRHNLVCLTCERDIIRKISQGGRSSFYCATCQL